MKGKVKVLAMSHVNGSKILRPGDEVTETDVNNFIEEVKKGSIELDEDSKKQLNAEEKAKAEEAVKKREAAEKARQEASQANESALETIETLEKEKAELASQLEAAEKANKTLANKVKGLELQISKLKKTTEKA